MEASINLSGGVEWEQGQAVTRMVEAMTTGNAEAMALAMADYAAALGTRVTSSMSVIAGPLLEEMRGMRMDRAHDAKIADHKLDLLMDLAEQVQRLLGHFEARLNMIEANTLASVITQTDREQLVAWARQVPDLASRVERLESARDADAE